MKKLSLLWALSSLLLIACGDSSGASKGAAPEGDEVVVFGAIMYTTEDDLPGCIEKFEGNVALVEADSVAFKCEDGRWVNKGKYIASEENIKNCTEKREGEIAYIVDEDKSLVCEDGKWVKASDRVGEPAKESSSSNEEITLNSSSSRNDEQSESSGVSKDSESVEESSTSNVSSSSSWSKATESSSSAKTPSSSSVVLPSSSVTLSSSAKSSSSSVKSSSSVASSSSVKSSSSVANGFSYGVLTDSRDGKNYKTVKIGTQEWMAENLNVNTFDSRQWGPWCKDASKNCEKYGRYFDYETAQSACPEGWRLPNITEWQILTDAVGGIDVASKMLKSAISWNGEDAYGFNALPAGVSAPRNYGQTINVFDEGDVAEFWSVDYWVVGMSISYPNVALIAANYLTEGRSVRCLKGAPSIISSSSSVRSSSSAESSSSSVVSSSSAILSSSAVELDCSALLEGTNGWSWDVPKECRFNPAITYGTMTDKRDNKVYKTIKIGSQTWMAENLNYADSVKTPSLLNRSWCYNDVAANCAVAGRLYTWAAAIDSVKLYDGDNGVDCGYGKICTLPKKVQGICPDGWHLPTYTEGQTLRTTVDEVTSGTVLKSQTGWYNNGNGGTDAYGFSALPAGRRNDDGKFENVGLNAYFWSADESDGPTAYYLGLYYGNISAWMTNWRKYNGHSVRCIKD